MLLGVFSVIGNSVGVITGVGIFLKLQLKAKHVGAERFLMKKLLCPQAFLGQIWSADEIVRGVDDLNNEIVGGGMTFLLEIVQGGNIFLFAIDYPLM